MRLNLIFLAIFLTGITMADNLPMDDEKGSKGMLSHSIIPPANLDDKDPSLGAEPSKVMNKLNPHQDLPSIDDLLNQNSKKLASLEGKELSNDKLNSAFKAKLQKALETSNMQPPSFIQRILNGVASGWDLFNIESFFGVD